ncbi:glycosyltransferase family 2 [Colletotrichum orchidophilum]|uniref:Glycosyltransferase family 2 n=1 Tax=Colletotrichum orchidophilum TaxID=1209926 RepID=A0A1G4ATV8_9PEZI|nr:glycosyltransferase family 2 [Colletotrichum orchidophilum]OHE92609.1 glycosyltransferase family 2 [Colletotrichum orchidophilum]
MVSSADSVRSRLPVKFSDRDDSIISGHPARSVSGPVPLTSTSPTRQAPSTTRFHLASLLSVPVIFFWNSPKRLLPILPVFFVFLWEKLADIQHKPTKPFYNNTPQDWATIFIFAFFLRYARLFCNIWGSWQYKPAPVLKNASWTSQDVTVVLPTIDPDNPKFDECILSVLENRPAAILIVTVGAKMRGRCEELAQVYRKKYTSTKIGVSAILHPSKRRQVAHAVPHVETRFTIIADDHVFWPSTNFIPSILAPFEDVRTGVVATYKRVRRTTPGEWSIPSIVNLIGCFYLLRHNWELRASNAIDGGVFVVSGRTAAYRSTLLQSKGFMERFCNEHFFFGMFGGNRGLGPDDDNFITREAYREGWDIKFQHTDDCTVETSLGDESVEKFWGQLVRWARTTFRSNPCMLRRVSDVYKWRMPFTYFAVYGAALFNFALLWDAALLVSFYLSWFTPGFFSREMGLLALWILWSKTIKLWPHILRHPSDLPLVICQILFAYFHSIIKFWALVTFWDYTWLGRNLDAVDAEAERFEDYLVEDFSFGSEASKNIGVL